MQHLLISYASGTTRFIAVCTQTHERCELSAILFRRKKRRKKKHETKRTRAEAFDNRTDLRPKFTSITLAIEFITFAAFFALLPILPFFHCSFSVSLSISRSFQFSFAHSVCCTLFVIRDVMNLMKRICLLPVCLCANIFFKVKEKQQPVERQTIRLSEWVSVRNARDSQT